MSQQTIGEYRVGLSFNPSGSAAMTRENALEHFHRVACDALGTMQCYPDFQPNDSITLPAVVYAEVGQTSVTTFDGPQETATAVRYDVRARSKGESIEVADRIEAALQAENRLEQLLARNSVPDTDLAIYRQIRTVMITD